MAAPKPKMADALQAVQLASNRLGPALEMLKEHLHAAVDAEAVTIEATRMRDELRRQVDALRNEQQNLEASIRKLYEEERALRPGVEAKRKEAETEHEQLCAKLHDEVAGLQRQRSELQGEIQGLLRRFNPE